MDVGNDATACNGICPTNMSYRPQARVLSCGARRTRNCSLDERIELLVATDSELQVARRDALDAQVLGRVASKFEHLSSEILEDGRRVDSSRGTNTTLCLLYTSPSPRDS